MNEKLEKYLQELKEEKVKSYQEYLMKQGVYETEFAPEDGGKTGEYPYMMQTEDGKKKRYKKNPIELTAEDIEKIENYVNIETTTNNDRWNGFAFAINVIAVLIYIVGLIFCLFIGGESESWGLAFIYCCAFAVSGTIMLGFSEIINLLHKINLK